MDTQRILFLISFFVILPFTGCRTPERTEVVSIRWQNNKAAALVIPKSFLKVLHNIENRLTIQLIKPGERTAILGEVKSEDDYIIFEPLVPFTRGLRYEVLLDNNLLSEIEIPPSESEAPELLAMYPSQDTVPENLLKMYFRFSKPMVEDRSLSYITMMNESDTLRGTFLDLQPELWNTEGTVLTLWLDPGRIKRDLIPNKEKGTPLKRGENYTLHISSDWQSKEGVPLQTPYSKTFMAVALDQQVPLPEQWSLLVPASNTTEPLKIQLKEALDYSLLMETIQVIDAKKIPVVGTIQLENKERTLLFTPENLWVPGNYTVLIETRLEDLAGNNLNRPFDRDVTQKQKEDQKGFGRAFTIH